MLRWLLGSATGTVRPAAKLNISNDAGQQKLILQYASEIRKFEIERFWQRSAFFWAFIGAAFVAYGALYAGRNARLTLVISAFGGLTSLAWTLQNRGSKYWQEAWEHKVEAVEMAALGTNLFTNREFLKDRGVWGAAEFSVSRLTVSVSDLTTFTWFCLFVAAISLRHDIRDWLFGGAVALITLIYAAAMVLLTKSNWREHQEKAHLPGHTRI